MRFSGGNRPPQTFSAHFLRESPATKLFRLISSGNRPSQNFFGSFPQEIARHKLFRLISSGNRLPQNFFGSFPQEIARHKTFSAHFLRKSLATKLFQLISSGNRWDGLPLISSGNRRMAYIELTLSNGPKSRNPAKFPHRKRPVASGAAGLSCWKCPRGRQLFFRSG